jgi:cytoplasmic iron level regulating protein YaaA (DUF328/UPF0246 family)
VALDASSFTAEDLSFAQRHLCIISGLYGSLRPLDLIQPYRLCMDDKLSVGEAKNLPALWAASELTVHVANILKVSLQIKKITYARVDIFIQSQSTALSPRVIVNVASDEYWGGVAYFYRN